MHFVTSAANVASGLMKFFGNERTNSANAELAREQMAFQERMSNTAYQRAAEDMRKAGINPMLVGSLGGATTPPGAMSSSTNSMSSLAEGVRGGADALFRKYELAAQEAQLRQVNSVVDLNEEQAHLAQAQADNVNSSTALNTAKVSTEALNAKLVQANVELKKYDLSLARLNAMNADDQRRALEALPPWLRSTVSLAMLVPGAASKVAATGLAGASALKAWRDYKSPPPHKEVIHRFVGKGK